jgi:hypothetical protein
MIPVDYLKSIGKPTDYASRKKMYEDLGLGSQYGGFTGTAQQNIGLIGKLGYTGGSTPTPNQANIAGSGATNASVTAGTPAVGTNVPSNLTPLQQQYLQQYAATPSSSDLYNKYSAEMGILEQTDIVTGLTRSIMDLEGKIGKVEGDVNSRMGDYQVTEAQRRRLQNVEEQPLRKQYLESIQQKSYQEAGLSAKQNLLAARMGYAKEDAERPLAMMKMMMDWEEEKKKTAEGNATLQAILDLAKGASEAKPDLKAIESGVDSILAGGTVTPQQAESNKAKLQKTLYPNLPGSSLLQGKQNFSTNILGR